MHRRYFFMKKNKTVAERLKALAELLSRKAQEIRERTQGDDT